MEERMKGTTRVLITAGLTMLLTGAAAAQSNLPPRPWQSILQKTLPLYGHRNWIVIADSAYPAQARPGITTVVSDEDQLSVLRTVLGKIAASRHVRPIIYTDRELAFLTDQQAPGVSAYRKKLSELLGRRPVQADLHENIIAKLDETAKVFEVLIIKTNMTIPYTSVFIRLDCAYWSDENESKLRAAMAGQR
jgi:hypothetical protein